jgi:hypothetical protein
MTWPSQEDLDTNRVVAGKKARDECVQWLEKLLNKKFLPKDVGERLVAMDEWGTCMPKERQRKLLDVFICRFEQGHHTVHIEENPCQIMVSIADERLSEHARGRAEWREFILATAQDVLNADLLPSEDTKVFVDRYRKSTPESKESAFYVLGWTPTDPDKKGAWILSGISDGRFVMFRFAKQYRWKNVKPQSIYTNRF